MRWRRHVPFALFASALAVVCVALARPTMSLALPQRRGHGDPRLRRLEQHAGRGSRADPARGREGAATAFAKRQPSTIRIGVVAFGDSAVTVLRPTNVKEDVVAAIGRLSVGGGTSLGQGLFTSLSTIAGKPLQIDESALESDGGEVDIGFYGSSAIVLLSDGENTSRARPAADRRGCVLGGRPRPYDRDRDAGGDGGRDRRVQRRDRARRGAADGDRQRDRRHVQRRGRRRDARADLRVGRPRARPRRAASTR